MRVRCFPLMLICLHCSTAATLTLTDRSEITGTITASSKEEIHLMTDLGERPVSREGVADISHPGKFHMLLGVSMFAAGIITFIAIDQRDCRDSCAQPATGIALPVLAGAAGAGIFFWGYNAWSDSRAALVPGQTNTGGGVGYEYRF